jgi:microcystin-dependent protein
MQAIAESLDNAAIDLPEAGSLPDPGTRGRWIRVNSILYRDTGSAWQAITVVEDSIGTEELEPGAVTNTEVSAGAAIAESKLALASDAAAGTASRRTLGAGATQACAGNDARLSDQRVPVDGSVTFAKLAAVVQEMMWKTGDIKPVGYNVTAGSEDPGWLLADGREVSRTTYAALFVKYGSGALHGAGNGTTTFNLPDYRGRPLVGKGTHAEVDTVGKNDGLAVGSRRVKHSHTVNSHSHGGSTGSVGNHSHGVLVSGETGLEIAVITGGGYEGQGFNHKHDFSGGGLTGDAGAHSHSVGAESPGTDTQGSAFSVVNYLIKT